MTHAVKGRAHFFASVGAAVVSALGPGGCAHHRTVAVQDSRPPTVSPAVRGMDHGLEMWWWVVADAPPVRDARTVASPGGEKAENGAADSDGKTAPASGAAKDAGAPKKGAEPERIHYVVKDSRVALEEALRPYLDRPVPISEELRERWRVCGLRMIAVPPKDLSDIEKTLRVVGPVQRQWLGEVPRWMDLVNGPEFEAGWCAGEDGIVQTPAGHVSLLGRCWSGPSGGGGAAMRLELAPQIVPAATGAQRFESALEPRKKAEEAGEVLTRLAAGFAWAGPDALVIVPERADVDWKEDGEAAPAMLPVRTLGELMLSTPATEKRGRTRAVVVLIPHPREKFELLP